MWFRRNSAAKLKCCCQCGRKYPSYCASCPDCHSSDWISAPLSSAPNILGTIAYTLAAICFAVGAYNLWILFFAEFDHFRGEVCFCSQLIFLPFSALLFVVGLRLRPPHTTWFKWLVRAIIIAIVLWVSLIILLGIFAG